LTASDDSPTGSTQGDQMSEWKIAQNVAQPLFDKIDT
jgi:hypothetical protein